MTSAAGSIYYILGNTKSVSTVTITSCEYNNNYGEIGGVISANDYI